MIKKINRFGEITINKNEALVTMPLIRLETEEIEVIEENYKEKIKELNYADAFYYAESITSIRDRLQITYDMTNAFDFHHIRRIQFEEMFPYFNSMIDIAKQNVSVLWEKSNFAIDIKEEKVKALLFDFEGFKLYKKDNKVDGLKELILLALTTKHAILGKPKKSDFIEQRERVFLFAEDIIHSKDIEEMEDVIRSYENQIQYEETQKEIEQEEKRQKSKWNKMFKTKRSDTAEKEVASTEDMIKNSLYEEQNKKESNNTKQKSKSNLMDKMTSPKGMVITIVCLLAIGLLSVAFDNFSSAEEPNALSKAKKKIQEQNKVLSSYRVYINANGNKDQKEKAYAQLDRVGYENLNQKDQSILVDWYIDQDKLTKAITADKKNAYQIGDALIKEDDGEERLKQLANQVKNNEVINFDIATLENKYQTMIENKDILFNQRRSKKLVEAYFMTNQKEELDKFMSSIKNDERNDVGSSYDNLKKYYDEKISAYDEKQKAQTDLKEINIKIDEQNKKLKDIKDDDKKNETKDAIKKLEKDKQAAESKIEDFNNRIKE
ncbi:hypothetical protein EV207_1251 [Scopulibacillus darangshiensis]|uniref:Uncharacterized protein n=1 Tax=Scopulibacillus darangshiensis TaxID=442528 RepID=A0A4R2NSC4_9BACL|nr:hypothetical protein [Scopulibacillus darangshiensis]TCP24441.1 hypothetical protein EV207_1251 [Scopulibacillus darangshiensis]